MYDNDLFQINTSVTSDISEYRSYAMEVINVFVNFLNENYDFDSEYENISYQYEAAGYSDTCDNPIFILLTRGSNPLSKLILKCTGDEFSHSCISFNPYLKPLYSFGSKHKSIYDKIDKPINVGFVNSNPKDDLWYKDAKKVPYALYGTFVDSISYQKMKERLDYFLLNSEKLKYSFLQLIKVKLNIPSHNQTKWFCSRFVAEILNAGNKLDKDPSLYRRR